MPRMMRMSSLVFVCALFACSSGESGPDGGSAPVCGDGVCASSEVNNCMADCGGGNQNNPVCGNNMCETGETQASCPSDCQPAGPVCGDNTCDMAGGENSTNCPGDCSGGGGQLDCMAQETLAACALCLIGNLCMPPVTPDACTACAMLPGTMCNLDQVCDAGEDPTMCPDCM
jgi:hypothetical protein